MSIPYNSAILLLDAHMQEKTFTGIFTAVLYIIANQPRVHEQWNK